MSQVSTFAPTVIPGSGPIFTETGNSGGPVGPDGVGNINVIGSGNITVVGNPGTFTLTISEVSASILTLTGNSGGAVGPTAGNINVISATTEGTARIVGNPGTSTLTVGFTDVDQNVVIGTTGFTASHTVGVAVANTGLGFDVFNVLTTGDDNVAIGQNSLRFDTTGRANVAVGVSTLNVTTGSNNIAIGTSAGNSYVSTEASNIVIGNTGTVADANTIRIGTQGNGAGQQNKAFVAGITGVTTSNSAIVTVDTVTGQLGETATTGFIQQLAGNTGTASGATVNVIASTAQGTSLITGDNVSTLTLTYTDGDFNTVLGTSAFAATHTPAVAVANTGLGVSVLNAVTTGSGNIAVGFNAGASMLTGDNNTVVGTNALGSATAGDTNTAIGISALTALATGSSNIAVGAGAGSNYAGAESNNILIGNLGVLAESAKIRIGTNGTHTATFIAGIDGVNVGSVAKVVTMASDQLGTATITAGAGITVTPGANTITIASIGSGLTWSVITADQTAAVENGYFCNKAGTLALALPATSAVGDVIEVTNENTALGVQFTQAAGQQILIGNTNTTLGATGTLTSSAVGDTLKIVCKVANTIWRVTGIVGNWTPA